MNNPYVGVNFGTAEYLISQSHWHVLAKDRLLAMYNTGLRHIAITNYSPSHPTYPLLTNEFFTITDVEIPVDIIECPNSEKIYFLDASMHISCLGSTAATYGHKWPAETPKLSWHDKFDLILADMQYPDGGGIIINHPLRSGNTASFVIDKLKYNDNVLGVEVYNHRAERDYGNKGYFYDGWDAILSQGYRCFGFWSSDEHNLPDGYTIGDDVRDSNFGLGRSILLVPSKTEQEALKAYRNGQFYGAYYGDKIKFTKIEMQDSTYHVETDMAERIDFISYSLYGSEIVENPVATVLSNNGDFETDEYTIFVRAVAYEDANSTVTEQPIVSEKIFTQPIMFKTSAEVFEATHPPRGAVIRKYVKVNGTWHNVTKGLSKKNGTWRNVTNYKAL